jgi:hypothetical protein
MLPSAVTLLTKLFTLMNVRLLNDQLTDSDSVVLSASSVMPADRSVSGLSETALTPQRLSAQGIASVSSMMLESMSSSGRKPIPAMDCGAGAGAWLLTKESALADRPASASVKT